jgi:hypothetical protein
MAFHHQPREHCQNLRCKEMYAHEPPDPEREARDAELYGTTESTAFWCLLTQTGRGPDGQAVGGSPCQRGRTCFVGIEDLT